MARSSCVVCCAWKMRCRGKVELMQQSLTSENPVGQVPHRFDAHRNWYEFRAGWGMVVGMMFVSP